MEGPPQNGENGKVLLSPRMLLAPDDIPKRRHSKIVITKRNRNGIRPQPLERPNAVDLRHEIELQSVADMKSRSIVATGEP
jgi:hypothetical protein